LYKYQDIGNRLKKYAIDTCYSVAGLERKLKFRPGSLSTYIYGLNKPGGKLLKKLEDVGCNIEWLMTGKKSPQLHSYGKDKNIVNEGSVEYNSKSETAELLKLQDAKIKYLELENQSLRRINEKLIAEINQLRVNLAKINSVGEQKNIK